MRRARMPSWWQRVSRWSRAVSGPETVVEWGLLTAAMEMSWSPLTPVKWPGCWRVWGGVARWAMPPVPWRRVRAWERRAMMRAASVRVRAPAMCAAAISPWEWPMTVSGVMPWACQRRASDTMIANRVGWTTSVRVHSGLSGGWCRMWVRVWSRCGARACSHWCIAAANTGESFISARPIPGHCDPWPGKTNTVLPVAPAGCGRPVMVLVAGRPAAIVSSPCSSSLVLVPITAARCSNRVRPLISAAATRSGSAGWSVSVVPRTHPASRRAWSRNALWSRPDTTHTTPPPAPAPAPASPSLTSPGSTPPKPPKPPEATG